MKNTEHQAVWRPYPDYPFVEANQFGEIRTKDRAVIGKDGKKYHIKGRVLKQQQNKDGYMYVHLQVNGKQIFLFVHRIVLACFRANPGNLSEVNHIDCDPTNNRLDNLEWCTHEYNITYREKYGIACNHPVFAVDLRTSKVYYFKSHSEAARQLGVSVSSVNDVLKGRRNMTGGYWFTEDKNEITKEKLQKIKSNMWCRYLLAINLETRKVLYFESQHEASRQLGIPVGTINKVVKGKQNKTRNYYFTNADENAVEKTRAKFGDEIANKVEELMKEYSN